MVLSGLPSSDAEFHVALSRPARAVMRSATELVESPEMESEDAAPKIIADKIITLSGNVPEKVMNISETIPQESAVSDKANTMYIPDENVSWAGVYDVLAPTWHNIYVDKQTSEIIGYTLSISGSMVVTWKYNS